MPAKRDMSINAVLAIYISETGQIVASEQIASGTRSITVNQLASPPPASTETDILQVDVRVTQVKRSDDCNTSGEVRALRVCYDMSGRRVPCI